MFYRKRVEVDTTFEIKIFSIGRVQTINPTYAQFGYKTYGPNHAAALPTLLVPPTAAAQSYGEQDG